MTQVGQQVNFVGYPTHARIIHPAVFQYFLFPYEFNNNLQKKYKKCLGHVILLKKVLIDFFMSNRAKFIIALLRYYILESTFLFPSQTRFQ